MPALLVERDDPFPAPTTADDDGLVAIGRDLGVERLRSAYASGIFPWAIERGWVFWYSPDPRMVLRPEALRISRRLARTIRGGRLRVTLDVDFRAVIAGCAAAPRPGQRGTWIAPEFVAAYTRLHRHGIAHSVEAWRGSELVGGLYGVSLGLAFFGESMFAREPDASKVAFVTLVGQLAAWGFTLVDCQVRTEHLQSLGAESWTRARFLRELARALEAPTRTGRWSFERPAG